MKFPVDLLANISQAELEHSAHNYMNNLLYSNPDYPEHLTLSDSTQVTIDISSVGFIPLYGSSDTHKILALFSPSDPFTAVALYLLDQWWTVDDIIKTADLARDGAVEVQTVGERIVLYILNRVVYRVKEMSSEELPFLCHGERDYAKILWNNGEAVGFYSVKPSGSLFNSYSTRSYQLPVMDSIYVRKCQRGKGFGLQMLEDFVLSFKEDSLGLRYPLTKSMYKVCKNYLCQYPGDTHLLWEVEGIGGPNQRTNIAVKIQAMDLSAVSKSLSFTEESLVITEVTEMSVEREAITTQIKGAQSMECTVEIVEEVTVLRATKVSEAEEVPVAVRGRSSGSKRRNIAEKTTEDKSEKVIRIEDIEAETPREQQGKTALHNVSELEQTETMSSVALEEKGEDVVEEEAATIMKKTASQDLEEADVTAAPVTKKPQVEGDGTQDMKNTSHDSQMIVENVASEIEETVGGSQKEDGTVLVVSEEVLEVHKEAETQDKAEKGTDIEVADEKSEERVTQHELSPSTCTIPEDGEAGKTGNSVAENETQRLRSQQHSKKLEGVMEETIAQEERRVLRGRTVVSTPTPKRRSTRHSQKVCEEFEVSATEAVEELAVTEEEQEEITPIKEDVVTVQDLAEEEEQQHNDELTNEEETEKQEEPRVEDIVVKEGSTDLPETALTKENKNEPEKEQKDMEVETPVIGDKQEVSDDEIEEPPVVQRKALRGRHTVSPKPKSKRQSKRHQKEEEHGDEADLEEGDSAGENVDQQVADTPMEEQEETETVTEEAPEDVIPSISVNVEGSKEVQEEEETEGETKTASAVEADKEEEADSVTDTVAPASETVTPNNFQDEAVVSVVEEPQEKDFDLEIPKLQKATVILVDLKTTCHHLSMNEAEEKPADGECDAPEKEQVEVIAAEEKDVSSCVAEEQISEPEMPVLEEEDEGKHENITEESVDSAAEAETTKSGEVEEDSLEKENKESASVDETRSELEEVPVIETRVLRSGGKTIEASCKSRGKSNQREKEDSISEGQQKEVDEAETGTVEVEAEMEAVANDGVTVIVAEEEGSAVSEICADTEADIPVDDATDNLPPAEVEEAMTLEEEEAPVVETRPLRSGAKTVTATPTRKTRSRKEVDEQEAENSTEEEPEVTTRTLRRGRISASATPKGKFRRTRKQIRQEEQKEEEISECIEETGVEEETSGKDAPSEKTNEEIEEIGEEANEEAASERQKSLEQETDVHEVKAVAEEGQNVVEEQSEVISKTIAERESVASGEEYSENNAPVTRSLRSDGKTSQAPPKNRSRRSKKQEDEEDGGGDGDEPPVETRILRRGRKSVSRSCKQLQKAGEQKESVEEAEVEEEEVAGLGSAEEPPTEEDEGKAPEEDSTRVEKEELLTVEVEKEVSEEGTMTMIEQEENTAGLTAAADYLVREGETDPPLDKPDTDSAVLTLSDAEATTSTEELKSGEMTSQLSDLQRVTVVLVDLKKAQHEVQEETAAVEDDEPLEKTAAEAEEEQREETVEEEEPVAGEHTPDPPADIEKTEPEKVILEVEGSEGKVEDVVTLQEDGEGSVEDTEAKNTDDEEEPEVTETRKRRSRKRAAKATPRGKSARSRQKKGEEEKEEASEFSEEEPEVQVRVLRRGRKSVPVTQRCTTRTQKQLQEEEEGQGGEAEKDTEEQEKGLEEKDAIQQVEPEMSVEKGHTTTEEAVTQQDAPEEGQAANTETVADQNTEVPAGQSADEKESSDNVAGEAITTEGPVEGDQSISTSEVAGTAAEESTLLTAMDDKPKCVSEEEGEASVIETRTLRSGEKAVTVKPQSNTTERQDDEQEAEAVGQKSTEECTPAIETRVLRKGRKSTSATPRKSKRARRQRDEEEEETTTPAEETEGEETQADENSDEKIEDKDDEEAVAQTEKVTEPEVDMEKVETVAEESFTKQDLVEEEQSAASQREASVCNEETSDMNKGKVSDEEEVPVVEPRILRSGEKAVKATSRSQTTKSQQEENEKEETSVEESANTGEQAVETRVLRKGRKSAPATPRQKSKRARRQHEEEEEPQEITAPAQETEGEGEEEEAGKESPEEKGEKAEEEGKGMDIEVGEKTDLEEKEVESVAEGESAVGDAEQKNVLAEEVAVLEKEDSEAAVDETSADTVQISPKEEGTNSAEGEETTVLEKSTAATEVGSDAITAEEEAPEEAPAVTRALRSRTKTSHATPSRRSRRQKDQGVVEAQQQEEENPEDRDTQEVHPSTDDEVNAEEQTETDETSPTIQEAGHPDEDTAENQDEEKADLINNRVLEPAAGEPATEDMESPKESSSGDTKEDKALDPSAAEGRTLRRRTKIANKEEDKAEEIQLPKQRSTRKRPRVDYRENDEDDEEGESEAATDKEEENEAESDEVEDNNKGECSANEQIVRLEESNNEGNLQKSVGAIEGTSEKRDVLNLVLDTDEEVETAACQEPEEDEQSVSEEEVEPIVIGNRVLRGRSIPSVVITPRSKPRRRSAKVQKAEESLSEEEKSPQSAQKRSLRKRKSTEVTPARKSKRHSRV